MAKKLKLTPTEKNELLEHPWIDPKQTAGVLDMALTSVYDCIHRKEILAVKLNGIYRIPTESLKRKLLLEEPAPGHQAAS